MFGAEWERWLVPLAIVGLVVVLAIDGINVLVSFFGGGVVPNSPAGFFAVLVLPAAAWTLLLVLVGLGIQMARPRGSALFLAFLALELGSLALDGCVAFLFVSPALGGPGFFFETIDYVSAASSSLAALGLFILVLLARPIRTLLPPPLPGTHPSPPGPYPPP